MKPRFFISSQRLAASISWALLAASVAIAPAAAEEPYALWASTAAGLGSPSMIAASAPDSIYLIHDGSWFGALLKFDREGRMVSSNAWSYVPSSPFSLDQFERLIGIQTDAFGNLGLVGRGGANGTNAFSVAKLDSGGSLVWVSRETTSLSNSANYPLNLTSDPAGNWWVVGRCRGEFTLGEFSLPDGAGLLMCKYSPSGQVLSVNRVDCEGLIENDLISVHDVGLDAAGNLFLSGTLPVSVTSFGGTPVSPSTEWGSAFIVKFSPSGALQWLNLNGFLMAMTVDRQGNSYFLESWARFGKLDPEGQLLWVREFPGATMNSLRQGITLDASENPVFTGEFTGTVWFDAIPLTAKQTGWEDFFIAGADPDGNIQWAMRGGGDEYDSGKKVAADASGNIFLGAVIRKNVGDFDGLTLTPAVLGSGSTTAMLAKISPKPPLRIKPAAGTINLTWPAKATAYVLEAATSLPAVTWATVTNTPTVTATERTVQLPLTGPAQFFRLRQP